MPSKKILGFSAGSLVLLVLAVVGGFLAWRKVQARRHANAVEIVPGQ